MLRFLVVFLLLPALAGAGQTPAPQASPLDDAKRLFDQLRYEDALPLLSQILQDLQTRPSLDADARTLKVSALELRARARFGLGDRNGARDDLRDLLVERPAFAFGGGVTPRLTALLEDVRKVTVGTVAITVDPLDATIEVDGVPVSAGPGVMIPLAAGTHRFVARRSGYKPFELDFTVPAGVNTPVTLTPERVSAVIVLFTSPAGVRVSMDGRVIGETKPGPPPPAYAERQVKAGFDPARLSAPFEIADVQVGAREISFALPCHVTQEYRVNVDKPTDYSNIEPTVMEPSVGTVRVPAVGDGGTVFLDGQPKGAPPLVLSDICSGPHTVEVRSSLGRLRAKLDVAAGSDITLDGALRPAVALIAASKPPAGVSVSNVLAEVERVYGASRTTTVFVPPADQLSRALGEHRASEGWLVRSSLAELAAAQGPDALAESAVRETGRRLAQALDAQAVAEVVFTPREGGTGVMLRLLAAGSGRPDDVEVFLDSPGRSVASLDGEALVLTKPGLPFGVLDVHDVDGVVVLGAEGTGAAVAGIVAGDVLTAVNGKRVTSGVTLERILADTKPGDRVQLTLRDRAGTGRQVEQVVQARARLLAAHDRGVIWNKVAMDLRARLAVLKDPLDVAAAQANLAVALMRLGNWSEARDLLGTIRMPGDPGVGRGTVLYLQGLCAEALSDHAAAVAAYKAAAGVPGALLTEDGPPIGPLAAEAEARLATAPRRHEAASFISLPGA